MDSAHFPYGIREDDALIKRILLLCQEAVAQLQPKVLVLACNTASTLALNALREALDIPVVGVVPAIKVAAHLSRESNQKECGLLATPATVSRSYTQHLIDEFAPDLEVSRLGSEQLAGMAEQHLAGELDAQWLYDHLNPWLSEHPKMRNIVLGCTHFPLLIDLLSQLWPEHNWVDSGEAVAKQTARVYQPHSDKAPALNASGDIHLYWTGQNNPGIEAYVSSFGRLTRQQAFPFPN